MWPTPAPIAVLPQQGPSSHPAKLSTLANVSLDKGAIQRTNSPLQGGQQDRPTKCSAATQYCHQRCCDLQGDQWGILVRDEVDCSRPGREECEGGRGQQCGSPPAGCLVDEHTAGMHVAHLYVFLALLL